MARVPKLGSQDLWANGSRNPATQREGRASAAPHTPHRLHRLALCVSVIGVSLQSPAGLAVSQNATPSLQAPDARMQAPIGHRQPRPSDLPPDVQRDEQLDTQSAQTQPQKQAARTQKQTANRRAQAGTVPAIDARKGCEAAEKDFAAIFGPNNPASLGSCLRQEEEARQQIVNNWTKYPASDRQKCIDTTVYQPSYVEWITCLEMYRDVRSLNNANKSVGAGTR